MTRAKRGSPDGVQSRSDEGGAGRSRFWTMLLATWVYTSNGDVHARREAEECLRKSPVSRPAVSAAAVSNSPQIASQEFALRCVDLTKSYGEKAAVSGVSLQVRRGEAYGLLGPNGAGRSTAIGMMVGLVEPDSGEVYVGDIDMAENPREAKKRIGYVPQEIAVYPEL